jgi:hypothetical protein
METGSEKLERLVAKLREAVIRAELNRGAEATRRRVRQIRSR